MTLLRGELGVPHVHQNKHVRKYGSVIVTVIDTDSAKPPDSPNVIVVVNQLGNVLSTITEGTHGSARKSWSTAYGAVFITPSAPATTVLPPAAPTHVAAAIASPEPIVAAHAVGSFPVVEPLSAEGGGFGFAYSPYMANGNCKTQAQVNEDFKKISTGYSLVRTYGTDCNQTATVLTAAKAHNLKLFAGIFDLNDLTGEVDLIAAAANRDWSSIETISIGNELVNSGAASPSAVVAAIGNVRGLLKTAGYTGKVVTVDTLVAARANPSLCDASDVCTVNCHPFFDGNVEAKGAGDFLTSQIPTLRDVLANKHQDIIISETGWPWKGDSNKAAVPSASNQADAISSIKSAFASSPNSIILFTTFNDMWKKNSASQFEAEQFWGFLGDAPSG
jgi:exo-beta-1,3-glucanase (GH17 family)